MDPRDIQETEDLARIVGIDDLPFDMQDEMLDTIGQILFQNVIRRAMLVLNKEGQKKLEDMFDKDAAFYQIIEFLESNVPNFPSVVKEEGQRVKRELAHA